MEGEWIEWEGGECPVEGGAIVRVQYARPANTSLGQRIEWAVPARELAWYHDGADDDIIAYRVVSK